jgi:hypothetical protein
MAPRAGLRAEWIWLLGLDSDSAACDQRRDASLKGLTRLRLVVEGLGGGREVRRFNLCVNPDEHKRRISRVERPLRSFDNRAVEAIAVREGRFRRRKGQAEGQYCHLKLMFMDLITATPIRRSHT